MDRNEIMFDTFLGIETIENLRQRQFDDNFNSETDITGHKTHDIVNIEVATTNDSDNNIYQATYYRDLVTLFDEISMEPDDTLVDFGCGLGRILFYCNQRHYCKTTGIEQDTNLYEKLLENAKSYQSKFLDQEERMSFFNMSAESYDIDKEDNYFYFFNPFSADIFQKVVDNIIESVKSYPRDVNIIVYYPTFEYQRIIRDSKLFVLKNIIKLSGYEDDPDEKVLVYHLSKYFV